MTFQLRYRTQDIDSADMGTWKHHSGHYKFQNYCPTELHLPRPKGRTIGTSVARERIRPAGPVVNVVNVRTNGKMQYRFGTGTFLPDGDRLAIITKIYSTSSIPGRRSFPLTVLNISQSGIRLSYIFEETKTD
jgi:hypothetical protein